MTERLWIPGPGHPWNKARQDALRRLWDEPITRDEIAHRLDTSADTVRIWARRLGLVMPVVKQGVWSSTDIETLRRMAADGKSAREIAAALNWRFSRNAVLGKLYRLRGGKPGESPLKPVTRVANPLGSRQNRVHRGSNGGLASKVLHRVKHPPKLKPIPIALHPPEALMVPLMHLTEHTCKFPCGPDTGKAQLFCGAPKDIEVAYCRWHCQVAYQPMTERRKRDTKRDAERLAA